MKPSPILIAHRGAMDEAPENTRAAFEAACRYPVHGFEFDVQLSRDGVPVIFHDATMRRINGESRPLGDYDMEDLGRMDWGGWFGPGFRGEPLLTLEDMLRDHGTRQQLMIEIKSYPGDRENDRFRRLADHVLRLMEACVPAVHLERHAILSFDRELLDYCARRAPRHRYVLNLEDPPEGGSLSTEFPEYLYGVCAFVGVLTPGFSAFAHDRGCRVMTYSCNNPSQTEHALGCGADVLMTDSPKWLTGYWADRSKE
ncbi:MAG: glycerophosphodiester phosphodiesterase [Thermodesulfobacteriota bacterium]